MSSRLFRVDLAEGARDFKHIATEPGLAMLDPQNVNYGLISKWLGELAAEPDWESADVVSFYVRQPERGRLADIRCGPASVRDLQGKLSADLEAIGQRLRKVKAESSTEQLLHNMLTRQYKHITEDLAARSADCCFIKYRRPGEPWRLVWCWGYQRTDLEPAKACVCSNDQCAYLFVNRKGTKARCPICATVPRRQNKALRFTAS
ncbi:MAG: hypothetical protein OES79_17085, partial [Planctomycetota bacterium]|nr:hypothetical protein [Planctomycetota bacterium]